MKKLMVALPNELTYQFVVSQLSGSKTSFFTEEMEGGSYQQSSPGADFEKFPDITLTILKDKNHLLEDSNAYLFVRPERLAHAALFVRIGLRIDTFESKGNLIVVNCRAMEVQLKKENLSTKHTWTVEEEASK